MRYLFSLLFLFAAVVVLSAQNTQHKIPYYDTAAVLPYLPLHKAHQDSLADFRKAFNEQIVKIDSEMIIQKKILKDSANMSTMIKAMRKKQLEDLTLKREQYVAQNAKELHMIDSLFRVDEVALIQVSADAVAKQKGYDKIYEKSEAIVVQKSKPTGWSPEDVTELVMKEMKLK